MSLICKSLHNRSLTLNNSCFWGQHDTHPLGRIDYFYLLVVGCTGRPPRNPTLGRGALHKVHYHCELVHYHTDCIRTNRPNLRFPPLYRPRILSEERKLALAWESLCNPHSSSDAVLMMDNYNLVRDSLPFEIVYRRSTTYMLYRYLEGLSYQRRYCNYAYTSLRRGY